MIIERSCKVKKLSRTLEEFSSVHTLENLANDIVNGNLKECELRDKSYLTSSCMLYHPHNGDYNVYLQNGLVFENWKEMLSSNGTYVNCRFGTPLYTLLKEAVENHDLFSWVPRRERFVVPSFMTGGENIASKIFGENYDNALNKLRGNNNFYVGEFIPLFPSSMRKIPDRHGFLIPLVFIHREKNLDIKGQPLDKNEVVYLRGQVYGGELSLDDTIGRVSEAPYGEVSLVESS